MDDGNRSSKEAGGGEDVEGSKAVMETTSIENEVIPQKEGKVEKEVEKESNEVVVTVGRDAGVAAKGAEATDGEDVKDVSATEENKAGDGGRAEAELGVDGEVNRNVDGSAHREMETQGGDPGKDDIKPHEGGEDQGNVLEATGQQGVKNLQQAQVKTELSQSSPAEAVSLVGIPLVGSRPEIVPGKIQASLNQSQGQQIGQEGGDSSPIYPVYIPPLNPYITPSNRMLSSYTRSLVNKPTPSIDAESPVELLLRKSIATYLDSSHSFTEEFLWMVANLTSGYLNELISSLHKYTEMQRKSKPSKSDAQLVLNQHSITPNKLFDQFEKQKEFKNRSEIDKLEKKTISLIDPHKDVEYSQDEPSLLFFTNENYEITELVPKKFAKPDYVPYFLPDLPPDYTYQKTPRYMDRITDLKEMRLKLVEESRLTEKSLYSLIDDEDIKWKEKFEMELLELEKAQEREIEREAEKEYDEKSDGEDSVMSEHPEIESEIETIELKEDKKEGEKTEEINKEKEEKDLKTSAISKRMSVEAESKKEIGIDMEIEESPNKDKVPEIEYTPLVTGEVESKKIDIATSESKPIKTGVEAEPIDPASGEGKVNSAVETEVTIAPPSVDVSGPGSSSGVPVDCINDAGTPSVSRSSGFDIVKYAQKRLKIKRKQIKRMSMIQKQRNENIFFQAELYLSPYATNELTPDIEDRFLDNINDSFKRVILSIRTSERAKKIKIEEILKERERKEKERAAEREEVEFGFTFGKNSGLGTDNNDDDDDDDESDKDMDEVFPEFDFPTTNQPIIEERRKEDSTGIPEETLGFNSSVTTPGFTPATAPVEDDIEMEGSDLEDELTRAVTEERQIGVIGVNNVIEENDGDDDDDDDDDDVLFDDIVADSNMEAIVPKIEAVAKKSPSAQEQTQPRKDIPGTLEANSSDEDEFEDI